MQKVRETATKNLDNTKNKFLSRLKGQLFVRIKKNFYKEINHKAN